VTGESRTFTDGGGIGLALCGNLNRVRFEPKTTVGSLYPSVNKEYGNDEHARGEANLNRVIFPHKGRILFVKRSLDVGQVIGRACSHRQAQ
jgi:hypothetical protein